MSSFESASGPTTAILRPDFGSGSRSRSFFSSTMERCATRRAAARSSGGGGAIGVNGSSNSPAAFFARSTRCTARSIIGIIDCGSVA